ncbi:MAG: hypothetical protein JWN74_3150 [Acidobacteriaceae bacterium]|jgi:hypothetical protein|nr:hypothetical protein [Acidobacteriaceae bacterium]
MKSTTRGSALVAEIAELQDQQLESFADATFAGFTPEQDTAHNKRSDRIGALQRALRRHRSAAETNLKLTSR